jgi:hypothetical protein
MTETTVVAENAPLGVQLWPTISPDYADNFILNSVAVHRRETGDFVVWTYRSGKTRTLLVGEEVVVQP